MLMKFHSKKKNVSILYQLIDRNKDNNLHIIIIISYFRNIIYFRGKDHIVSIDLCLRNQGSVVFVMPYMKHDKFSVS